VSEAFAKDIVKNVGIKKWRIAVLYDRAVEGKFKAFDD